MILITTSDTFLCAVGLSFLININDYLLIFSAYNSFGSNAGNILAYNQFGSEGILLDRVAFASLP